MDTGSTAISPSAEREREAEEAREEEAAKLRKHRWRGAAGSDFVN